MKHLFVSASILCIVLLMALSGAAQTYDVYFVNYFSNANYNGAPDGILYATNPAGVNYPSYVCKMIYVFREDQQMAECCGCNDSPNDLAVFSVNNDIAGNPLTKDPFHRGTIVVVAAAPNGGVCDAANPKSTPLQDVRLWVTHIQDQVKGGSFQQNGSWPITETEFSQVPLNQAQLSTLQTECSFIELLGSGRGICSCGSEKKK